MKKKQHKKAALQDNSQKVFTIGELDLTLKIDFRDEDLVIEENQEKTTKNFEDLKELKDLSFIENNKKLLSRIKVTSKNEMFKLLLIGNKNSKKKYKIDHICYGFPNFQEEEKFFANILGYITEKNGLILNPNPLDINGDYHIKIEMTHKGEKQEINLGSVKADSHEDDNEIKGEGQTREPQQEQPEEDDGEDEYEDYEPNEMMKQGYIPKFKRKKSVLCNLVPTTGKYEMIYLNSEDFSKIPGNFKMEDMIELLEFFKRKKSKIFINYYKGESGEEEDKNKKKENEETKDEENEKTKNENQKKKPEPSEEMKKLNIIYYITDIYFFDKKQAIKEFDAHYKAFTEEDSKKSINSRNVYDYFIKGIATGTEKEVPCEKTGLFLDEFNKFCIIHVSKIKTKNGDAVISVNRKDFDPQPFPKINMHNMEEVKIYKDVIKQHKNELYGLFLSEMITTMGISASDATKPEVIYPSYLTGIDLVKKKLELLKNNIEINEETFYKIKRDPKLLEELLEKLKKDEKEGSFKLDCTNLITSNKKEYVSLYDYHLKNFFSSDKNRKELKDKGFINEEGYIRYDPVYRSVMGSNSMNKKTFTEEEKKSSLISSIKELNVHNRIKDKEVDCGKEILKQTPITNKKIPFQKSKKETHKKRKKRSNEGGSSDSGSSSDEGRSGSGSSGSENNNYGGNSKSKNANENKSKQDSNKNKNKKKASDEIVFLKDMLVY